MTIFQLECFYNLSQTLNYTQSAKQLFITQPALSRSIASLEKELDMTLFVRDSHSVSMTPAGYSFAETCKKIIYEYQLGIKNAKVNCDALLGSVRIGLPDDSFENSRIKLIHHLKDEYPGIQVNLRLISSKGLLQALKENKVDFIITSVSPPPDSEFILIDQRIDCAVVSSFHPLAFRKTLCMSDLKDENFILLSKNVSATGNERVIRYALNAGYSPKIVAEAAGVPALLTMISCDMGISILYKEHQTVNSEYIRFIPLTDLEPHKRYIMWKKDPDSSLGAILSIIKSFFENAN